MSFVRWVLEEAQADGIKTLFFLARDGYILQQIGQILAPVHFSSIECKYFYCSRYALRNAPKDIIAKYMVEEGMDADNIAIVDTGWLGTVQRDIQEIRHSYFGKKDIIGYYFGMFTKGYPLSGTYKTYLFSPKKRWLWSFGFNANVFECLCAADHGMTIGYEEVEGRIAPKFKETIEKEMIKKETIEKKTIKKETIKLEKSSIAKLQIEAVLDYVTKNKETRFKTSDIKKRLKRFMQNPTIEEAKAYGKAPFAHDPKEQEIYPLADVADASHIKNNLFFYRLLSKLTKRPVKPLYWIEGTAVLSGYTLGLEINLLHFSRLIKLQK